MFWLGLVALSTIAVCVLLGRHDRAAVAREWDMMLGGRASEHIRSLERTCELDHLMADDSWQAASQALKADDRPEVVRLLDLSYQVLEAATVNRRVRLRAVRVCARMAAAMAPAPPLLPVHFETTELRTLAGVATLLQQILVSAHERFVVQAHVLALDPPDDLGSLPAAVEVAIYRIVDEALANVVKHANASRCQIVLSRTPGGTRLEIADDGSGIPAGRISGVGLQSMRERALELGGSLTIEPVDPSGTRILAELPGGRMTVEIQPNQYDLVLLPTETP